MNRLAGRAVLGRPRVERHPERFAFVSARNKNTRVRREAVEDRGRAGDDEDG